MHTLPHIVALVTAVGCSIPLYESLQPHDRLGVRGILRRRRRALSALHVSLRVAKGKGKFVIPAPALAPAPRAPVPLALLIAEERRLIALYDAVLTETAEGAPHAKLLLDQRAEVEQAHLVLSAALVDGSPTADGA